MSRGNPRTSMAEFVIAATLSVALNSFAFGGTGIANHKKTSAELQTSGPSHSGERIYVLDTDNHRVQMFSRYGVYQGQSNYSFDLPTGIALDATRVYVKDGNYNCQADEFDTKGNYILQFGVCANNQTGRGIFDNIGAVATDADGNVWVTSPDFYYMQKVDSSGNFLSIVCMANVGVTDCPQATSFEVQPYGIALDASGNIYVTNVYPFGPDGNNVVKFDSSGNFLFAFGSTGSGNGQFNDPQGIAIDSNGNIYVVDSGNNRVQKFNKNGTYQGQTGTFGSGNGQFSFPVGIAFDAEGDVYVTDVGNNRVQVFDRNGVYQFQFGSHGQGDGQFSGPYGVAILK